MLYPAHRSAFIGPGRSSFGPSLYPSPRPQGQQGHPAPTFVDNGGRHPRVPRSPPGFYRSPSTLLSQAPYVKNLSFCVRASATRTIIWLLLSRAPSEIPLPRAARLFYSYRAGPMEQGVSYVQNSVVYIRNLRPDSMSITSLATLAYRGGAFAPFTGVRGISISANFAV